MQGRVGVESQDRGPFVVVGGSSLQAGVFCRSLFLTAQLEQPHSGGRAGGLCPHPPGKLPTRWQLGSKSQCQSRMVKTARFLRRGLEAEPSLLPSSGSREPRF